MNELPAIGYMRKEFWDCQGKHCMSLEGKKKKGFWREINTFSPLFYRK